MRLTAWLIGLVLAWPWLVRAELAEVLARGELRHIAVPYGNFVTGTGDGLDVELVRGFAAHLGVRHRLVMSSFRTATRDLIGADLQPSATGALRRGSSPVRGDLLASGFSRLPWRESAMLFSLPTFPSQVFLVAPVGNHAQPIKPSSSPSKDVARTRALIGRQTVLLMKGTVLDPASLGLGADQFELRFHGGEENFNELIPAMLKGDAELALVDLPSALFELPRWGAQIKILGPISLPLELAVAFPKDSPKLHAAFNEYFAGLRADGRYERLVHKYYPTARRQYPGYFGAAQ